MSFSTREYIYQMALFVCLIVAVVATSYKYVYNPKAEALFNLEEAMVECNKCEKLIERIDCCLYDPDCTEPIAGDMYDKYLYDIDSIATLLDVKVKIIKVKIIESLACLQKSSSHTS